MNQGWWQASDGRWYPPETHPSYRAPVPPPPLQPTPPPRSGVHPAVVVLLVLLAVGGLGFVGCVALVGTAVDEAGREREARDREIAGDVELTGCRAGRFGPEALIEITNRSSKRSNYMVKVIFLAPEGTEQYGSGSAYVSGLAPGRTTTERVSSFGSDEVESVECEVANVTRFSDE